MPDPTPTPDPGTDEARRRAQEAAAKAAADAAAQAQASGTPTPTAPTPQQQADAKAQTTVYATQDPVVRKSGEGLADIGSDIGGLAEDFVGGVKGIISPGAATMGGYTPNPEAFNLMQQGAAPLANAYDAQKVLAQQAGAAGLAAGTAQQGAQQALGTGAQGTFAGIATGNQQQGAANAGAFNTTAADLTRQGQNAQYRPGVNVNYGESANLAYQQAQDRARALGLVTAQTRFAAQGPGPSAAQAQLQQGSEANQLRALSLARSGRGFGQNAAAMQQALGSAADTQAQTNQQAAILRAQEAANWRGQQLQAYGQAQQGMQGIGAQNLQGRALAGQESQYQAGLSDQQRARNDALMSQYASLGLNAQQFGASNQLAYNQLAGQNQAQGYQAQLGFNTLGQNAYGQGLQYNLGQGQLGQQYAGMGLDAYKAQLAASMGYENLKSGNILGTQQFNAGAQNNQNNGIIGGAMGLLDGIFSDEQGKKNIDMLSGQSDDPVQEQLRKSQEAYEARQAEANKPKEKKGLLDSILSDIRNKTNIQPLGAQTMTSPQTPASGMTNFQPGLPPGGANNLNGPSAAMGVARAPARPPAGPRPAPGARTGNTPASGMTRFQSGRGNVFGPNSKPRFAGGILSDKNSKKTIQMLSDELNSAQLENEWMAHKLGPEALKNAPGTHDLVRSADSDRQFKAESEGRATSRVNAGFEGPRYDVSIGDALIEPSRPPTSAYESSSLQGYLDEGYDARAAGRLAEGDQRMWEKDMAVADSRNPDAIFSPSSMAQKFTNYQYGASPEGQVEGEQFRGDLSLGSGNRANDTVAPRGTKQRPPEWDPYDPEIGRFWGVHDADGSDAWGPADPGSDREQRDHDTARYFSEDVMSDETKKKDKKEIDDGLEDIKSKYRSIMPSKGRFEDVKPPPRDQGALNDNEAAQARTMAPNRGFRAPRPTEVDMSRAPAYSYEYKNPGAPGAAPGRQVGPMAQDLGHIPGVVKETPQGKMVDGQRLTMANTAAIGQSQRENDELRRKLDELKAQYASIIPSQGSFR